MEFEIGKWYISDAWNSYKIIIGAKFTKIDGEYWHFSEIIISDFISNINLQYVNGNWYNKGNFRQVSISEIQEYLPINHPDRISEKVIPEDYSYLIKLFKELNIN